MGLFNRRKESDLEKAIRYIQEEYPKQALEFERKLNKLNAEVDKQNEELDEKLSKIEAQLNVGFSRIESCFNQNNTQVNQNQVQMQNTINEYYRRNPATQEEEKEAEEYLKQLMGNNNGRSR